MPKTLGLLSGMFSLIKYGLTRNDGGFGIQDVNSDLPSAGILELNKTVTTRAFSYETFEGLSLRGGFDHQWTGTNNDAHVGRVVPDPTKR